MPTAKTTTSKYKKQRSFKTFVAVLLSSIIGLGLVVGMVLLNKSQDNRQQASVVAQRGLPISSLSSNVYQDNFQRQFLVRNSKINRRTQTANGFGNWEDITSFVNNPAVGQGDITSFNVEVYVDNLQRQFLVRGGKIYRRTQTANGFGSWEEITSAFNSVGSGTITSFNVTVYQDNLQRQFLVRGGKIHRRTQTTNGFGNWEDITSSFNNVGSGSITSFHATVYQDNLQRQFLVKGDLLYRRTEPNWNTWEDITASFDAVGQTVNEARIDDPINKKVLVLEFNPIIENQGNRKLTEVRNWYNPKQLEQQYIQDLKTVSGQVVRYTVAQRQVINAFPTKQDNYIYSDDEYIRCANTHNRDRPDCHAPDLVNYRKILTDYQVCEKLNRGEIDEVWLWGGPYFGYYESIMAGPNAFPTNEMRPITGTTCNRHLHIMGFNYQRPTHLMLENMGHRVEGTIKHLFANTWRNSYGPPPNNFPSNPNELEKLTARGFDRTTAGCGNIHGSLNKPSYDPNNYWSYDFTNNNNELNTCESWNNYPDLSAPAQTNNCNIWGCTADGFKKYWLSKIPKYTGNHNNIHNNWWKYVLDYSTAVQQLPAPLTETQGKSDSGESTLINQENWETHSNLQE